MTKNNHFSPASEKGHFDGLVDEGKPLWQKLALRTEFAENTKLAENLRKSAQSASKNSCSFVDDQFAIRNTLYEIRSTNSYVRNYKQNMQNKANFQKSQMNVTDLLTMNYGKMDTWSSGKNKANSKPIQTQFKANTNPIQTQTKPISNVVLQKRGITTGPVEGSNFRM